LPDTTIGSAPALVIFFQVNARRESVETVTEKLTATT